MLWSVTAFLTPLAQTFIARMRHDIVHVVLSHISTSPLIDQVRTKSL